MKKRRYSDDERAEALVALSANGGNVEGTARQLGIPERTLEHWAKGQRHPEARQMANKKKKPLADCLEALARKLVQAMPDKAKDASLQQIAVSLGIAVDKMLLLRGEPTVNVSQEFRSPEEAQEKLAKLLGVHERSTEPGPQQ